MKSTFGARLRAQREKKGVALVDIANQSKIKASLLEALERDDLSYWPHGLFGRAYIRSYAKAVGLDPEPLLREFLELHPDPVDEFSAADSGAPKGVSNAIRSLLRRPEKAGSRATESPRPQSSSTSLGLSGFAVQTTAPTQLATIANLCSRLQQVKGTRELVPVLDSVAEALDATGLVIWLWDSTTAALKPWLTHGYSSMVVAQLPPVRPQDDNAIAAAFRSETTCVVDRGNGDRGAIVVPVIGGGRCLGALALELRDGGERRPFICESAAIVAALMVRFIEMTPVAVVATA